MKKLKKLTLKQLENEMTVIGSDEQRGMYGGSRVDENGVVWWTQSEMYGSENWAGGYVDGMGYVSAASSAFSGCGEWTDGANIIDAMTVEGADQLAAFVKGTAPLPPQFNIFTAYVDFIADEMNTRNGDFALILWNKGYHSDDNVYIGKQEVGNDKIYTLYDSSGNAIAEGKMTMSGWEMIWTGGSGGSW